MDRDLNKRSSTGGRISSIVSNAKKASYQETNTDKSVENIDPEILKLLGLEDVTDLDYGEYKTLLREQMMAGRMRGTQMSSEDTERITNEFKRVKSNTGKFVVNSTNVGKTVYRPRPSSGRRRGGGEQPSVIALLEGYRERDKEVNAEQDEKINSVLTTVPKSISSITKVLGNMNNILGIGVKTDKAALASEKQQDLQEERQAEENAREASRKKLGLSLPSIPKPEIPFMDQIKRFFSNILFGGLAVGLLEWLQDPKNQESIDNFVDFVVDKGPLILGGILGLMALPVVSTILGVLAAVKGAVIALAGAFGPLVLALGAVGTALGLFYGLREGGRRIQEAIGNQTYGGDQQTDGLTYSGETLENTRQALSMLLQQTDPRTNLFGIPEELREYQDPEKRKEIQAVIDQIIEIEDRLKQNKTLNDAEFRLKERIKNLEEDLDDPNISRRTRLALGRQLKEAKTQLEETTQNLEQGRRMQTDLFRGLNFEDPELLKAIKANDPELFEQLQNQAQVSPQTPQVSPLTKAIPTATGMGQQGTTETADYGTGSDAGPKGYIIVPGHAAGGGAPGEMELTPELSRNIVENVRKRLGTDAPIQVMDMHSSTDNTQAAFLVQQDKLKKLEEEGYEVIEIHMDASIESGSGTGRGVIPPMPGTDAINPVEADFARTAGSFPREHRGGLAATDRGVSLIELGNMSPELQRQVLKGDGLTKEQLDQLTKPLEDSLVRGMGNINPPSVLPKPVMEKRVSVTPPRPPGTPTVSVIAAQVPTGGSTSGTTKRVDSLPVVGASDPNNDTVIITKGIYSIIS